MDIKQLNEKFDKILEKQSFNEIKAYTFTKNLLHKCAELDAQYDDEEGYVVFYIIDGKIDNFYYVPSELIYDMQKTNMFIYLDNSLYIVKDYLELTE